MRMEKVYIPIVSGNNYILIMPLLVIPERLSSDLATLSRLPSPDYVSEFCRQALEALGVGAKKASLKQAATLLSLELDLVSGSIMALSLLFVEAAKVCPSSSPCLPPPVHSSPPPPPPSHPQRNLSASDLSMSMGDVAMPEDSKHLVSDFYGQHCGELREGLGHVPSSASDAGGSSSPSSSSSAPSAAPLSALGLAVSREELRGGAGAVLPASGASATLPEYRSLDWRLEVEVSRRSLHDAMAPSFTLQLGVAGLGPAAAPAGSSSGAEGAPLASSGPHALMFTADYQALKRAAASLASAGLERSRAHVKRVYKI